jgi:predicted dehydrogenase
MNHELSTVNSFRWGIIGCGRIAHRFAEGLSNVAGAKLVSVWLRPPEPVNSFVEQYGGLACGSSVEGLLLSNIDIIYI